MTWLKELWKGQSRNKQLSDYLKLIQIIPSNVVDVWLVYCSFLFICNDKEILRWDSENLFQIFYFYAFEK